MDNKKPIIGISPNFTLKAPKMLDNTLENYSIKTNYSDVILKYGGIPFIIPYQINTIDEVLKILDGLIISGGKDIHPMYYNEKYIHPMTEYNIFRDEFELLITQKILKSNIPFLGICRGMQILNVASNGTLIQHIPDQTANKMINHLPDEESIKFNLVHEIKLNPESILRNLVNQDKVLVNSNHHQAVKRTGKNLRVSAIAPDGIIEAIESTKHEFVLGIEWHPEYLNDNGLDLSIFKQFIKICRKNKDHGCGGWI